MALVSIYHNIVWSKYKGAVFSALHELPEKNGLSFRFTQIAETDGQRTSLSGVDRRYHRYPFKLLFRGSIDAVSTWRMIWMCTSTVWNDDCDLVVLPGYHRYEYWAMLLVCMIRRKPRAVFCDSTQHDNVYNPRKAFLKEWFFRRCQGYFCYGRRSAEFLRQNGAWPNRIFERCQAAALPFGYDAEEALANRLRARQEGAAPRFLYVGRLSPEKDLPNLIRAFKRFMLRHGGGQLRLVGAGPMKDELLALTQSLELGRDVVFTGPQSIDELADEYARATCLVLSSRSEAWGLVVNEALHYGCPVVVSELCGCRPELVIDDVTGIAFRPGDVELLSIALEKAVVAFRNDESTARACQDAISQFVPESAAAQLLKGCLTILGRLPHKGAL